ncbi:GTP-binding protein [Oceanobacillus senegalensis]|uniref:GTP-binding protein n=2 Tax=Oceanobacillus senegalensis TaxID=1936063 RepID=UPI000A30B2CC|nr:GTP-binding protein [Oceanobacillus senegalensis]
MSSEKDLINKSFYRTLIEDEMKPLKVLGEQFMDERKKEVNDSSNIRFAQGEIYFHHNDFEAAIFKWEQVTNELKPWAEKNIADAHLKLDLLAIAEDYYTGIETDSTILRMEILLQLFSLYIQRGNLEMALESIKEIVQLEPNYPQVTEIARTFYEDQQDWANAIHLAVGEAIRTKDITWFEILESYADNGLTSTLEPSYFNKVLVTLHSINLETFERLTVTLWESYKQTDLYFTWLEEINYLLIDLEQNNTYIWEELSELYKETFLELLDGQKLIWELTGLMPKHLTNWIRISTVKDSLVSAASVLAWNDTFPSGISDDILSEAKRIVAHSKKHVDGMEEAIGLFKDIAKWAQEKGISLGERLDWMVHELLGINHYHIVAVGPAGTEKIDVINRLIGEELVKDDTSAALHFKDANESTVRMITDDHVNNIAKETVREVMYQPQTIIDYETPISFFRENKISWIETPGLADQRKIRKEVYQYLNFADSILFVLNMDSPLVEKDLEMAVQMKDQAPDSSIHFLLKKSGKSEDRGGIVERITSQINDLFPEAMVLTFTDKRNEERELQAIFSFVRTMRDNCKLEEQRTQRILHFIDRSIKLLMEKRLELESSLTDDITWNGEMATKLEGALNQVADRQVENIQTIKQTYNNIKEGLKEELIIKIPELIRDCADLLDEKEFQENIHEKLNDEMNHRVMNYIDRNILPNFRKSVQGWVTECEAIFNDSQDFLNELCDGFNQLYKEEKLNLDCDFKVLGDWARDMDRMTSGNIEMKKVNILTSTTFPALFYKSAGKLFSAFTQHNGKILDKYKQFIEGKDYSKTAESITEEFMQQFELFEKTLERDIHMFFVHPLAALKETIEETNVQRDELKETLSNMRENPEVYQDPLTLFEVKLKQLKKMYKADEQIYEFH